jgi:hypothetical protein
VISIKETNKWNTKAAERLTMFIMNTPGPIFGSFKIVQSISEKNDSGTFGVFVIKNLRPMGPGDEEIYAYAKKIYNSLKGKTIEVERETDEDVSFDTDKM